MKIVFYVLTLLLLSACGGGGGSTPAASTTSTSATATATSFTTVAMAGELLTYTVDTTKLTYSYTITASQYGLTGKSGSGTLTLNSDGTYSPSGITNAKVVVLPNGLLLGAIPDSNTISFRRLCRSAIDHRHQSTNTGQYAIGTGGQFGGGGNNQADVCRPRHPPTHRPSGQTLHRQN